MKMRPIALALAAAALLFSAGCESVDSRIKEKPDVFAKLDPETQAKIKQGIVDLGFTEDMVYLALGAPDNKRESISAQGRSVTWIYNTYYDRYEDGHFMGHFYRDIYFDPYVRSYRLYYHQAFPDVYVTEKEERIRVVFKNGKAAVIEQAKD